MNPNASRTAMLLVYVLATAADLTGARDVSAQDGSRPAVVLSQAARRLHHSLLLFDGHNDLPWAFRERGMPSFERLNIGLPTPQLHTDIERLKSGGVKAQFWSVYVPVDTRLRGESLQQTLEQIEFVHSMARRYPEAFALCRSTAEIERATADGKIASLIGVEGGHSIENSLAVLQKLYDLGARYMTLTHSATLDWADASTDRGQHGGLTEFGEQVVAKMNELGMLVDLSHVADDTMRDALRVTKAPVIFSHSSARAICDHPRNVPDDILPLVKENRGVIMVNFYSGFVAPQAGDRYRSLKQAIKAWEELGEDEAAIAAKSTAWDKTPPLPRASIHDVVDHIDHLVKHAGIDCVGIGSDFDGIPSVPQQLEDVSKYPFITQELLNRGYPEVSIRKIMGENVMRAFREAEAVASRGLNDPVRAVSDAAGGAPPVQGSRFGGYDRDGEGEPNQSRSVTYAQHAMAATSDLRSTQAAVDILKAGGSAVDAAIAANAVLGVVEPMSCGIGGDLFAIAWSAADNELAGLNASGRAPASATLDEFERRQLKEIPTYGPLSWTVPGCVAGWHDLHTRYGKLPWARLFEPAIRLAEEGFPVAPVIAGYWKHAETSLQQTEPASATFLINGQAPCEGDLFRNTRLAATYREIAEHGANVFYHGEVADAIDRYSQSVEGGLLRLADLNSHVNEWVDPVSTNYRGHDVWELPPSGQGIAALQMLNIIERHDVSRMGWGSPDWTHLFVEAKKLSFADRAKFYADMSMANVPLQGLISKEYAAQRAKLYRPDQALTSVPAGDPKLVHGDTVYLCVVDKDRNCCSLIQSNYHGFGSQLVAGDLGFALQNRGALFALDPNHLNCLAPGKRPFHTIIPAMVTKDGRPEFVFGVMGGDMQPQGHVQVLVNWIDFGMNIQMAGDAARLRHEGSASPTGTPESQDGGTVFAESGIPAATLQSLQAKGHSVETGGSFGGYQGILIDWERGVLQGASEPRKDGAALGY